MFRKIIGGKWEVVEMREGYRVVSWWPPFSTTIVVPPSDLDLPLSEVESRVQQTHAWRVVLSALGGLSLVALVIGVPVGMRWFSGGLGFLGALALVLLLSWIVTALAYVASGVLQISKGKRMLFALPRLNPFAAPAAGEALLQRAVEGAGPIAVAKVLMEEMDFEKWVRPMAWDVLHGVEGEWGVEVVRVVGRKELERTVVIPPPGIGKEMPWCPRCGAEFTTVCTTCPSCDVAVA